ncbi:MAG: molecular chaperone HtpG [Synergistaceae bacterium]|nr:molecular chaperone HtpG [Synergistaceae bacterium]MBQ3693524.1 molecular chaperone HtpG [Synergistaceae bacterium]
MSEEKFYFQSEAAELLKMMISSVYSNRDIFLRELISNASDALDKRRIECLKDSELAENTKPEILITSDSEKKILSVSDNGIGMSRDDLIAYLGTIAKSGTKEFLKAAKNENHENELIGQFGVGFYSVFMAADKVEVLTRKLGSSETYKFISDGDGSYTIEDAEQRSECGTTVTLYLRHNDSNEEEFKDYSNEWVIREIIEKYSDFISWPVVFKDKVINSQKAIWQRPDSEIKEEEYNEFYKHLTHDWRDPLTHIKINAEGATNFKGLLFIPSEAPYDMFMNPEAGGISLYINRVFIMNDCKELIPEYLRFVRGVIDSEDLPLNISREILQDEPVTRVIRKSTQRKILVELKKLLSSDREKYIKFWSSFGRILKEGIIRDSEYAKNILEIALFRTTNNDDWTTLAEYESRMKPDQEGIYCLTGSDNLSALKASPKLEAFTEKNLEVLLMTDTVDSWILAQAGFILPEGSKKLLNIASDEVSPYSDDEKKENENKLKALDSEFETLKKKALEILGDKLENVKPSLTLTNSPACIRDSSGGMSVQIEYTLRAMGQNPPAQKRILELNANHPVIKKLLEMSKNNDEKVYDILRLLYDQSMILEGVAPDDPADFVKRIDDLMTLALVK